MILQELLNSGLPWSKPKYDGADVLLFSQSDDPLMKGRFLQSKEFYLLFILEKQALTTL
jgi:hypothetical protein